jgi:Raf kinase inhibitor-like YbhB/YbcL family protein
MRPALPSQDGTVSTTAASTIPNTEDDFFDTVGSDPALPGGAVDISSTVDAGATVTPVTPAFAVTAPWRDGAPIDPRYTCKGDDLAPALSWTAAPAGTQEIAVTLIDQDFNFDHWTMAGVAPNVTSLAENTPPEGAVAALNGSGAAGYTGPCPPAGVTHTYRITIHYLNRELLLSSGGPAADMRTAIDDATIATAQVTGTFTGS